MVSLVVEAPSAVKLVELGVKVMIFTAGGIPSFSTSGVSIIGWFAVISKGIIIN